MGSEMCIRYRAAQVWSETQDLFTADHQPPRWRRLRRNNRRRLETNMAFTVESPIPEIATAETTHFDSNADQTEGLVAIDSAVIV